jgi:hypothetical protein
MHCALQQKPARAVRGMAVADIPDRFDKSKKFINKETYVRYFQFGLCGV